MALVWAGALGDLTVEGDDADSGSGARASNPAGGDKFPSQMEKNTIGAAMLVACGLIFL